MGGNRWGKGENLPLIGLVVFSVLLSDSDVQEKGRRFRFKLKYTEKRHPISVFKLGKGKRKSQAKLILKQNKKIDLKILNLIHSSSPFSLLLLIVSSYYIKDYKKQKKKGK